MKLLDLNEIKNFIPSSIQVFLSHDLTSKTKDYRLKIRNALLNTIEKTQPLSSKNSVLDLTTLPTHSKLNISVSHCPKASGFALADKDCLIGLDLEDTQRASHKLIQRISTDKEIKEALHPQGLLSAKESSWKALNQKHSIATVSQMETSSWNQVTQNWSNYKISLNGQSLNGDGFLSEQSGIYISFFISYSTFG